ncbi:fibronectin type III domain-containing protein [Lactococcus lactis subsp. lactis bv. diacetylactis]|uniref:Fibronectin type III domain-containing protein n=1 Tax=Lactococcus lactis subsp. lactis bv. diacetylactis TaxID=44688 RepID=A0A8B3EYC9_LACLL|nr:fibronectin type III domain-containing protein [Lactococcus lactis]MCT3142721.1 fibronectin type III domain-containing protein [Lactococcus lactis]QNT21277.1 fibronectin type III domain-containing protein [Lactococcus lactis subsp. lactis bv. diacetylactis]RKO32410.1 fibronectin type III domain-containing protein [Lactococcus lactis subsp. lactis bv. diacetylactis]
MADKNYLHTAYANSADGTDGFTTVYPNLNLLKNTRTTSATSTSSAWGTLFSSSQIYDSAIKSKTGVSAMTFSFDVFVPLNAKVGNSFPVQLKGQSSQAHGDVGTNDYNTIICQSWRVIEQSDLGKTIRISVPIQIASKYKTFDAALADTDSITIRQVTDTSGLVYSTIKLEPGSTATPYMPSSSEVTTADWPKYVGTYVDTNQTSSTEPSKYDWNEMKYRVYLDGVPVGGSKLLSFDLENLKAGTSYNVQVSQINGNVESDKSESIAFKTTLPK